MPQREGMIIMLNQSDIIPQPNSNNWDAYFWVNDAKALYEEFKAKGLSFEYDLTLKELYGNLEFALQDPDGYTLAFGQEVQNKSDNQHLITPAPTSFIQTLPILDSADVQRDIAWYAEKTGFVDTYNSSNYNPKEQPLDYAVLSRAQLSFHLQWHAGTKEDPVHGGSIRFQVQNIRPLFEEFVKRGTVKSDSFRENTPWGTNEFGFYDLNKNALFFFEGVK
jgi:uncharacterized glyoxalase superfamily protein PhnB